MRMSVTEITTVKKVVLTISSLRRVKTVIKKTTVSWLAMMALL